MERFLEFLYTGTYDVEKHPWSASVPVSMLSPGEIKEELHTLPGVNVAGTPDEDDDDTAESPASPASGGTRSRSKAGAESGEEGNGEAEDGTTESEWSEHTGDGPPQSQEPEEEYNEFYNESSDSDESESDPLYEKLSQAQREPDPEKGYHQWFSTLADMEDLYLPLRLYVMADKYDVPALKLLARDRFYRAAEVAWRDAESFPDVVDELYSTTPPTDLAMREIVCRLVGSGMKESKQRERMEGVMRKHGDFAVGVMNYMIHLASQIWT